MDKAEKKLVEALQLAIRLQGREIQNLKIALGKLTRIVEDLGQTQVKTVDVMTEHMKRGEFCPHTGE